MIDFGSRLNVVNGDRYFGDYHSGEQDTYQPGEQDTDNDQGEVYRDRPRLMAVWDRRVAKLLKFPAFLGAGNTEEWGRVETNNDDLVYEAYSAIDFPDDDDDGDYPD